MSTSSVKVEGYNTPNGAVGTRETVYGPASSLWRTAPVAEALADPAGFHLFRDDFYGFDASNEYTLVADTDGSATLLDAAGGILQVLSDGDDNDEAYVSSKAESFIFEAGKPLWFEARVIGSADNLIIGLSDTVGANTLLDTEAGPAASFDGAVFFVDAGVVWKFETSNAGTQVTNAALGTFAASTAYRVGFHFDPANGTTGKITPYLNGVAGTAHSITLAGLEEMHILFGVKSAGAAEGTLLVDYVQVLQAR
jgi:hypothetical protein